MDALSPTFAMSAEASASLELAYRTYLETGDCLGTYKVGPIVYTSDFTLMLQASHYRLLFLFLEQKGGEKGCCCFLLCFFLSCRLRISIGGGGAGLGVKE